MRAKRNLCWLGACACALITGETSSKPKVSQKLSYIIPVEKSDAESVSGRGRGESCPCRNALPASGCVPTESVNADSHCSGGISSVGRISMTELEALNKIAECLIGIRTELSGIGILLICMLLFKRMH